MTRRRWGSITKLDDDRHLVRYPDGYHSNGKRRRASHVVRGTYRDAEMFLAARMLDAGEDASELLDDMTLAEYWAGYYSREIERLAPKTVNDYRSTWARYLDPLLGDAKLADITARSVRQALLTLPSPGAQRNAYKLLRQMLNIAASDGVIDFNPLPRQMRLDKVKHRETKVYTLGELPAFLDAIYGTDVEAVALCQLFGGLRREEATGLTWSDFRFETVPTLHGDTTTAYIAIQRTKQLIDGEIVIGEGKTDRSRRTVIISGDIAERLRELAGDGWLLDDTPTYYASRLKTLQRHAGIRQVPPTGLRATFSTIHAQLGTPDALVSMMMGHSQLGTRYRHYLGANVDAQKVAASSFNRAFGETLGNEKHGTEAG